MTIPINEIVVTDSERDMFRDTEGVPQERGIMINDERHTFARTLKDLMRYFNDEGAVDFYTGGGRVPTGTYGGFGVYESLPPWCTLVYDRMVEEEAKKTEYGE